MDVRHSPFRRRGRALGLAAAAAAALVVAGCAPPPPADTTPPEISAPTTASFATGVQVARGGAYDGTVEFTNGIPAHLAWTGSDAGSGICGYDVQRVFAGTEPEPVVTGSTATEFSDSETDYDDQFGGGTFKLVGWDVTAHDCAGNVATAFVGGRPIAVQEDGSTAGYGTVPIALAGTWATTSCDCLSGAAASTTAAGASATYRNPSYGNPVEVALVMSQGPGHGAVSVQVDGVEQASVDTGADAPLDRVVVWSGQLGPRQELRVVNAATPGRPQVDLDALLLR